MSWGADIALETNVASKCFSPIGLVLKKSFINETLQSWSNYSRMLSEFFFSKQNFIPHSFSYVLSSVEKESHKYMYFFPESETVVPPSEVCSWCRHWGCDPLVAECQSTGWSRFHEYSHLLLFHIQMMMSVLMAVITVIHCLVSVPILLEVLLVPARLVTAEMV